MFGREFGEGDGKKRENGEKEDEDEVEVKECDKCKNKCMLYSLVQYKLLRLLQF